MAAKGQAGAKSRASGNSVRENGDSSGIEKINPALAKWIINVDQVKVDPRNPRTHPPYNLEAIKNSLTHFSQQTPIVISKEKIIIKGNGTYEAALALGWKKIAAIPTDLASKKLLTGYKVADNKTGDLAEWDYQILSEEMKEFIDLDWQGLGWAEWELAPILAAEWHPRKCRMRISRVVCIAFMSLPSSG